MKKDRDRSAAFTPLQRSMGKAAQIFRCTFIVLMCSTLHFSAVFALSALIYAALLDSAAAAADSILYTNDFQTVEIGKVPQDMMVLDGNFSVKEEGTNKFLELPGAPLDTFSAQFGPAETNALSVSASIRSTAKGRRIPILGLGLYGVAGFRLQLSGGKKCLELYKDQSLLASVPFEWKSGEWTRFRLQAQPTANGFWKAQGKAWPQDAAEASNWMISAETKADDPSGRPSLFGSPFSGTPIQFDNLRVASP